MFSSGKAGPKQFALITRKTDNMTKISPAVKQLMNKQIPNLSEIDGSVIMPPSVSPGKILQQIDSSFESFFNQRDYTERNFSFYL